VRTRKPYRAAIFEIEDWMQHKVTLNEEGEGGAVHDTFQDFSYYFFHKYEQNFTDQEIPREMPLHLPLENNPSINTRAKGPQVSQVTDPVP
jgi:hypothetical protein